MAELEVYLDRKLLQGISELAVRHYGEDSESSRRRVIETALQIRIIWSNSVERGQREIDEAVSKWEFSEPAISEGDAGVINDWLFRR